MDALGIDLMIADLTGWITDRLPCVPFDALIEGVAVCMIGVLLASMTLGVVASTLFAIDFWHGATIDVIVAPGIAAKMLVGANTDT